MPPKPRSEATLSIRLLWPFARLINKDPRGLGPLASAGIELADLGNPEARVPHTAVVRALEEAVRVFDDATLGLRAGQLADHGDYDVLEYAARSAPSFGDAMAVMARYMRIMHEAIDATISVEGPHAIWRVRVTDGVRQPPAINDNIVSAAIAFSRRNVSVYVPPVEVHLIHPKPSYADEYERILETTARFGMPSNAVVMRKERLEVPMLRANSDLSAAFEAQARRVLESMKQKEDIVARVREEAASELRTGPANMKKTARRLGFGVATLRRKLENEGTTFSAIVDDLRRELAEEHLGHGDLSISEIAFLLGFSDVRAFGRAFRRWTGSSPSEFRAKRAAS
jgi:AraC-like DNA-binding protein